MAAPPVDFRIDPRAARRAFERAATLRADDDPLAREIERRMAERLQLITFEPRRIVDAGCGIETAASVLAERYPTSELIAVDNALPRLRSTRHVSWMARMRSHFASGQRGGVKRLAADFTRLPLANDSIGMVWSNLALNWAVAPEAALVEWQRVLEVGGLVMFSCYGPDTLRELRSACDAAAPGQRVHAFVDMHDLGDMLVAAGFSEPVMDMERVTLTYADLAGLARDLRTTGQVNVLAARERGLLGRRAWAAVATAYEAHRVAGRLPATFEIVYGHAWKAAPRPRASGPHVVRFEPRTRN